MSSAPSAVPKVGVAVFCLNSQGDFLLGKRKGSNGHNSWGLPGGHLELGEEFEECAAREVMEEVGLELRNVRFVTAVNNVFAERQHYVTIFLAGNVDGEPQNLEPDKCERWEWISWAEYTDWSGEQDAHPSDDFPNKRGKLFYPMIRLLRTRPHVRETMLVTEAHPTLRS